MHPPIFFVFMSTKICHQNGFLKQVTKGTPYFVFKLSPFEGPSINHTNKTAQNPNTTICQVQNRVRFIGIN